MAPKSKTTTREKHASTSRPSQPPRDPTRFATREAEDRFHTRLSTRSVVWSSYHYLSSGVLSGIVQSNAGVNVMSHVRGHDIVLTLEIIGQVLEFSPLEEFYFPFLADESATDAVLNRDHMSQVLTSDIEIQQFTPDYPKDKKKKTVLPYGRFLTKFSVDQGVLSHDGDTYSGPPRPIDRGTLTLSVVQLQSICNALLGNDSSDETMDDHPIFGEEEPSCSTRKQSHRPASQSVYSQFSTLNTSLDAPSVTVPDSFAQNATRITNLEDTNMQHGFQTMYAYLHHPPDGDGGAGSSDGGSYGGGSFGGGIDELLRVCKSIKRERTKLKVFEGTIEGSVDSGLAEEVKALEELHENGSREFGIEFDIQVCGFMIGL
ncbi:hypothetical protein Acr_15g0017960 [Actinidia rufa]|uniref:Uncharacterized protein n=1 Tax=Actinidia rufa TaxID=165716 RepID=A0A7J0FZ32_9ERIC|nr:hypothetical protein Acr_15g0017960 [Actinidia rufa]